MNFKEYLKESQEEFKVFKLGRWFYRGFGKDIEFKGKKRKIKADLGFYYIVKIPINNDGNIDIIRVNQIKLLDIDVFQINNIQEIVFAEKGEYESLKYYTPFTPNTTENEGKYLKSILVHDFIEEKIKEGIDQYSIALDVQRKINGNEDI
jgi:hypothetical protein